MQRRKTRKGFWWWSWLLIFFAAGGTGGGWFVGEKLWEKAPKDYVSTAVLKVDITPPYVAPEAQGFVVSGLVNEEESQVLSNLKSVYFLKVIGEHADAWQRWGVDEADGVDLLRRSISFEMLESKELEIKVTQQSPEDALHLATAVVEKTINGLSELADQRTEAGLELLAKELSSSEQVVSDAKAELVAAIKNTGATINPTPSMNLDAYMVDEDALYAKIAWDRALEEFDARERKLRPMQRHWERKVRLAVVVQVPELPTEISGPLKEPYQTQGAVAGVTVGLLLGLLAMLGCWKLFS
ncbi:hypothetical protein N9916_00235 [Akkermansiaceae bacterium]|nr:hypothetical protein [Akkermansiaceae bacterium]MDC1448220.1 hypothetical protein [bacterium]MDB4377905.1 hypothetical protein [Akkermansiaceae bacterium]MDB4451824.1 hypothetical protein [Akkermansiaceae bacterium]MDB4554221.1 hypothetical protein [Akkermansiaceae bacterium]